MSNRDDTRLSCDDVRSLAFDARATDAREAKVTGERRARFDRHLEDCSACREYVDRVDGMLGHAAEADPADWASREDDEAFDAIVEAVDRQDDGGEAPADGGAAVEFWPRSYHAAAGLAAGIALTVAGFLAWRHLGPGADSTGPAASGPTQVAEDNESPATGANQDRDQSPESAHAADLDELSESDEVEEGVEVHASPGASWEITDRDPVTVRLDAGTLLVEYLPTGSGRMRVRTRDTEFRVTGTVFYVATDGVWSSAGVAEGSVEVDVPERNSLVELEAGQRLGADYRVEPMSDRERESIDARVDLERHRAELKSIVAAAPEPEGAGDRAPSRERSEQPVESSTDDSPTGESPPQRTKSPEQTGPSGGERPDLPDPVAERRRQARAAMERRDFEQAARKYEAMLDELPDDHEATPSVHLDVARVYLHYLDRPKAAAGYLRTFVRRWPDDPAAESARDELCRIAGETDDDESLCDGAEEGQP